MQNDIHSFKSIEYIR